MVRGTRPPRSHQSVARRPAVAHDRSNEAAPGCDLMNNPSRFTRASRSYAVPFTKFSRSKFTVLHAAGFVNPLCPTLSVLAEFQAFLFTWNEAVELQRGGRMSKTAMPIEECAQILGAMASSCRLPKIGQ